MTAAPPEKWLKRADCVDLCRELGGTEHQWRVFCKKKLIRPKIFMGCTRAVYPRSVLLSLLQGESK